MPRRTPREIGRAILGDGRAGRFRRGVARRHPAVRRTGIAGKTPEKGRRLAAGIGADFVTPDRRELLKRPVALPQDHAGRPAFPGEAAMA